MKTAILLIAHGSRQAEANDDLHALAAELRREAGDAIVEPAFLELAAPTIDEAGRICVEKGVERVILTPYFLSAGFHVTHDLQRRRDELAGRFPHVEFILAEPLGRHPLLREIVLQRVKEATGS